MRLNCTCCRLALALIPALFLLVAPAAAQEKVSPVVKGFGAINPIPKATKKPDAALDYRIVVDVYKEAEKPDQLVPGLHHTARMLNLHGYGGVPEEKLQVVLVVHGPALALVLDNRAYREKFGTDNPNIPLIRALKEAGVELYVCGQSMIARGYDFAALNPAIGLSVSALTVLTEYQLKGYALITF
ncbi:MAG: DsrE family protein [Hymenobacteraceae bacterium]|nr:DsrE family protein [Hymenobacteraceae bacterium]